MDLLSFYRGEPIVGASRHWERFEDILHFTDDELERCHDYIQWLFPIPEESMFNSRAPVLTPALVSEFRSDEGLRSQVVRAHACYEGFLGRTSHWVRMGDHNHLRITRALRFLSLAGFPEEATSLFRTAYEPMAERGCLTVETEAFWRDALGGSWPP